MRKALVVGINYYQHGSPLYGCVNDANNVKTMLERNGDGSKNFDVRFIAGADQSNAVSRNQLKDHIGELFADESDIALLYFAGHGHVESTGGYLLTSDSGRGDEGVSLTDVLVMANNSEAKNRIIILDSCHSGIAGDPPTMDDKTLLADGVTILTASTEEQYATEVNGQGIFTSLLVDALDGAAANLVGEVSPGSVYSHIDQSLGSWEQRPVFKTNVKSFVSLRKVTPNVQLADLLRIIEFFPTPDYIFPLDPTFESEMRGRSEGMPDPDSVNTEKFAILQKFNRVNLVVPTDAPHMWHAAMESKGCRLTVLGQHYRRLVERDRI